MFRCLLNGAYKNGAHLQMDISRLCAIYFCFVGIATLNLALRSKRWISAPQLNFGLWVTCSESVCHSYGMNAPAYIHATRAFMITAVVLSCISFIGYFLSVCLPHIGSKSVLKMSGIPSCVAGCFAITAMGIFMGAVRTGHKLGKYHSATEILEGWVSGPFLFISVLWVYGDNYFFGLWVICVEKECTSFGMRAPAYIHATRAFLLMSTTSGIICSFFLFVGFYYSILGSVSLIVMSLVPSLLAVSWNLIGMATFTAVSTTQGFISGRWFSVAFFLGWTTVPLFVIVAALVFKLAVDERNRLSEEAPVTSR
ncbi:hypothetical protein lerEdw1_009607 [Lerista edwardsae]|nr:hypothetical protein lerEdw1_009607 [Lerista edwardsae]